MVIEGILWAGIVVILAVFLFFLVILYVRDAPAREIQHRGVTFQAPDDKSIALGRRNGEFVCLDLTEPKEPKIVLWPAGKIEYRYGHTHVHVQRLPELWSDWKWNEGKL